MKTQKIKIEDIKSNPNNPRIIKDDKFHKLVRSIKDFPEMLEIRPIVVDSDFVVLGGNMRLKACLEAGLKEVPVLMADQLTEEQKKEFIIKDNANFGDWDWEILQSNWDMSSVGEWGVDVFELPKDLDYSILGGGDDDEDDDGDLNKKIDQKKENMTRALCIPFDSDNYDKSAALVKKLIKRDDVNMGAVIYEALKKLDA